MQQLESLNIESTKLEKHFRYWRTETQFPANLEINAAVIPGKAAARRDKVARAILFPKGAPTGTTSSHRT
jgi:hypothetical protein